MGFALLRWREAGRSWSRGEPPPRGSVEYCGVPEVFQPPPREAPASSGSDWGVAPKIWEITATELDAGNRWVETMARSVDYARRVRGDSVLSEQDALDFTDFYKRWKKFASRVTTWSLYDRALKANKAVFEALLAESRRLRDLFVRQGMAIVPVPHLTDLVLLLRGLPARLTPREMSSRLETVAGWGQSVLDASRTTGEWVEKAGLYAAGAALFGPAGLVFAHYVPTYWSSDRRGLEAAVGEARRAARYLGGKADASASYGRGEPVYDEFVKRASRVYAEAAGLAGVQETRVVAAAEAVDAGAKPVENLNKGANYLLWLLGIAGASYLGGKWLESRSRPAAEPEDPGGDVVVLGPDDHVVVEGDEEGGRVYDPEEEEDEETSDA
jgi:hypothetical protein